MDSVPHELLDVAKQVAEGKSATTTVRTFLTWFGHERRGVRVVNKIRRCLDERQLITDPDFAYTWLDGRITFGAKSADQPPNVTREWRGEAVDDPGLQDLAQVTTASGPSEDPTYRIGKLDAANRPPISVNPDASIREAITIMLRNDFSQMPVMTSDREVKGAISWKSLASRLALGKTCQTVRECMEKDVKVVDPDVSLFRVIDLMGDHDFVLVRNDEKKISGIVTVKDLSQSFHHLGRPFLLLSEIENHIRALINGKFSQKELEDIRNPNDPDREISDVSDLTFGEYVRLLQKPEHWAKVGLPVDRATFVKDLERVNCIRNDVMHFDPDGIGGEELEEVRKTARFVQDLLELTTEGNVTATE